MVPWGGEIQIPHNGQCSLPSAQLFVNSSHLCGRERLVKWRRDSFTIIWIFLSLKESIPDSSRGRRPQPFLLTGQAQRLSPVQSWPFASSHPPCAGIWPERASSCFPVLAKKNQSAQRSTPTVSHAYAARANWKTFWFQPLQHFIPLNFLNPIFFFFALWKGFIVNINMFCWARESLKHFPSSLRY